MIPTVINRITAFVLVFILFSHNINTLAIIGDFLINQEFIAKTLCIQKEAQKGCNGKCQLRKELTESNANSNTETPFQENKPLVLDAFFISDINQIVPSNQEFQSRLQELIISTPKIIKMYLEIDTPPPNFC
ncbi:hypothetical protein [Psychroserpens ponticola]|uniref:Uncharacterized protein n=1 Tax=Psychroserpens ponticola TaxID=2932268 RepID=A0ABY7RUS8_9FLAO|nr:hypothetical protein [Psychroserpens ponticola]WCO00679.1 hypothetical protein MUN68_011435 [Psychroserpens ponticola]